MAGRVAVWCGSPLVPVVTSVMHPFFRSAPSLRGVTAAGGGRVRARARWSERASEARHRCAGRRRSGASRTRGPVAAGDRRDRVRDLGGGRRLRGSPASAARRPIAPMRSASAPRAAVRTTAGRGARGPPASRRRGRRRAGSRRRAGRSGGRARTRRRRRRSTSRSDDRSDPAGRQRGEIRWPGHRPVAAALGRYQTSVRWLAEEVERESGVAGAVDAVVRERGR